MNNDTEVYSCRFFSRPMRVFSGTVVSANSTPVDRYFSTNALTGYFCREPFGEGIRLAIGAFDHLRMRRLIVHLPATLENVYAVNLKDASTQSRTK